MTSNYKNMTMYFSCDDIKIPVRPTVVAHENSSKNVGVYENVLLQRCHINITQLLTL